MANPRTRWNTVDPEEQATLKPHLGTSPLIPSPIPEFPQLVFHFPGVLESLSGMPTVDEYAAIQERFLSGLPADERSTVLIDSRIYVHVLDILTGRAVKDIRPAQFHSWALKTFQLQRCTYTLNHPEVVHESWDVFHEGKKIALVEELYTILCRAHCECGHGGAEETIDEVRREWRFVPKDLIARFVEACPTCMEKYAPEKQVTSFKTATRTNKEGQYVDGKPYSVGGDDDLVSGQRIRGPATPCTICWLEAIEGLPHTTERDIKIPLLSLPRLVISPVSECSLGSCAHSKNPTTHARDPHHSGLSSSCSTSTPSLAGMFWTGAISSAEAMPSQDGLDAPLGSDTMELLVNFEPPSFKLTQPKKLLEQSEALITKRLSECDLDKLGDQPPGQHALGQTVRIRSVEVFDADRNISRHPTLALNIPRHSPNLNVHINDDKDVYLSSKCAQRPEPINVRIANAPFISDSLVQGNEAALILSGPLNRSHSRRSLRERPMISYATGRKSEYREGAAATPALSHASTSTNGEVESLPTTPSSAASVWSQDSAPNSAIFWNANVCEFLETAVPDREGSMKESDFPTSLEELSAFLSTLRSRMHSQ